MKFIFRGIVVFEYVPDGIDKVIQHKVPGLPIIAWEHCRMINDDYKLLSIFFDKVYRHSKGEQVDLTDIKVN